MSKDDRYSHLGEGLDDDEETGASSTEQDAAEETVDDAEMETDAKTDDVEDSAVEPPEAGATAADDAPVVDSVGTKDKDAETAHITVSDGVNEEQIQVADDATVDEVAASIRQWRSQRDQSGEQGTGDRARALVVVGAVAGAAGATALRRLRSRTK